LAGPLFRETQVQPRLAIPLLVVAAAALPSCVTALRLRVPLEGPARVAAKRCVEECRALRSTKSRREWRWFVACLLGCPGATATRYQRCPKKDRPPAVYCAEITAAAGVNEPGYMPAGRSPDGGQAPPKEP
jgi:hypothetical protein